MWGICRKLSGLRKNYLADIPQLDLNEIIDLRFSEIEAELFVITEHADAIERQLPAIIKSEFERMEIVAERHPEEENYLQWAEDYLNEVLPRVYRSSILVQLWAVFEGAIIEIAKYLREESRHSLDIDDVRGGSDYERAITYYEKVLRFPLLGIPGAKEHLDILLLARNAIARVIRIRPSKLNKLRVWERDRGGIVVGVYYVSFTESFVRKMTEVVCLTTQDLIIRVKETFL